jgi:hypothetical protein
MPGLSNDRAPWNLSERTRVINGLVALRRAGFFQGVWIDADIIKVRESALGSLMRLSWLHAGSLVREFERLERGGRAPVGWIEFPLKFQG